MKVYAVTRSITAQTGDSVQWVIGVHNSQEAAEREAQRQSAILQEAAGMEFGGGTLVDFLAGLGIAAIENGTMELDVKDSLVTVPKLEVQ